MSLSQFWNHGGVLGDPIQYVLVPRDGGVAQMIHGTKALDHVLRPTEPLQLWHKDPANLFASLVQIVHLPCQVHPLLILMTRPAQT